MALLDLKTEGHRETIIIDGAEFLLTPFESFSISEQHRLAKDAKRVDHLANNIESISDEEAKELEKITSDWFHLVKGDISGDVIDKLLPGMKQEISTAYFLAMAQNIDEQKKELSKNGPEQDFQDSVDSIPESESTTG